MNETEGEAHVVSLLEKAEPSAHFFKSEDRNRPGMWDQSYCIRGAEGWIEFKHVGPGENQITIRPKQYRWGRKALDSGRRLFLMLIDEKSNKNIILRVIPGDYIRHRTISHYSEWEQASNNAGIIYKWEELSTYWIGNLVSRLRGEV